MSESARKRLASRWPRELPHLALAGVAGLAALALIDLLVIHSITQVPNRVADFFAFWSFAKFVRANLPADIYDPQALHGFQRALGVDTQLPFLYPPGILLPLWPFGLLPYAAGFALWVGGTLAIYLAAMWARRGWGWTVAAVLLAPATVICGALGQSGFLFAGLLIAGFRLSCRRPGLGGALLGLAALKPQLVLLVPLALLAAGLRRTFLAAAATGIGVIALSSVAFGPGIWPRWLRALPGIARIVAGENGLFAVMPTVTGNLHLLGCPPLVAGIAQVAAAAIVAAVVFRGFRGGPSRSAVATLLAAAFLATPYALISDLPLLTGAAVLLAQDRLLHAGALRVAEIAVLVLAVALPYLMIGLVPFPFSAAIVALMVALAGAPREARPEPLEGLAPAG